MKQTIVLNVNDMHCGGCENRINSAIKQIKGVKSVKANHAEKNVVIVANGKIDMVQIENAITNIGFTVVK